MYKHKNIYCHKTLGVIGHKVLMEACMVQACHTPQRPLQNHPSGHLGGWAMAVVGRGNTEWTSKSGQNYLPIPEPLTMASCRKDWKVISAESSLMSLQLPNRSRNWTELTHGFCEQSNYLACCIKGKHTSYWCRWHDGILWCSVVNLFSFFKFIYFFNFFFIGYERSGFEQPCDRVSLQTPTWCHCYCAWTKPIWDWCLVMDGGQKYVCAQWRTRSTIRHCRKTDRQTLTSPSDSVLCLIGS